MAFIWTWMNSDTVSAEKLGVNGSLDYIRVIASSTVTKCGEFIEVHREFGHEPKLRLGTVSGLGAIRSPLGLSKPDMSWTGPKKKRGAWKGPSKSYESGKHYFVPPT